MDYQTEQRIRQQAVERVKQQPIKNQLKYYYNDTKHYLDMLYISQHNFKPQEKYYLWKANEALRTLGLKLTGYDDEYKFELNQFDNFLMDAIHEEFFDAEFNAYMLALRSKNHLKNGQNS